MNKIKMIVVLIVILLGQANAGFILREENDSFIDSDDQYTQGLDLLYVGQPVKKLDNVIIMSWGIRNLIYTPTDISESENQPDDRPWAGLFSIFCEEWKYTSDYSRHVELMVGVLGEWSQSEGIQTLWHKWGGCTTPEGWDNQIPNEPFVNLVLEYYVPLYSLGRDWRVDLTGIYGGAIGTAFINAEIGVLFRAGWRIPKDYSHTLISPSVNANHFSVYLFSEVRARGVAHNAMLGGSLWQDGPSRDLEHVVEDLRTGIAIGVDRIFNSKNNFRFSYSAMNRSEEYKKQKDPVDFGAFFISLTRDF